MTRWTCAGAGVLVLVAAGCQPAGVHPGGDAVAETAPTMRVSLPEWWQDEPTERDGVVSVCAMAESADLAGARRAAIDAAEVMFRKASGGEPVDSVVQSDSVRLRNGEYRAFVRVSAAPSRSMEGR